MMRSTALDHVSADLAWDHRDHGTDGDRATPSRGRRLCGTTDGRGPTPAITSSGLPPRERSTWKTTTKSWGSYPQEKDLASQAQDAVDTVGGMAAGVTVDDVWRVRGDWRAMR